MGYLEKQKKEQKIIRVLAWLDSPACATGFASVARGILTYLGTHGYLIDVIGINDTGGWKDPQKYPYRIYPAKPGIMEGDYFGRPRLINAVLGQDKEIRPPWDIIFTLNDPFILEQPLPVFNKGALDILKETQDVFLKKLPPRFWFKLVSYWPIDSPIKPNWVDRSVSLPNISVAYTNYGKNEVADADRQLDKPTKIVDRMRVIYHGIDTSVFNPPPQHEVDEFRTQFFENKVKKDTFLISVIARNQLRKDLPRTLQIFSDFIRRRPDSFLYIHAQENDAWGSLREYARNWRNLEFGVNWAVPNKFTANQGFPVKEVNKIYNASDCILSTSLGEGFGFYNLEGFATKTLVVAPNNTVHPELFNYDKNEDISDLDKIYQKLRGIPLKCRSTSSEWATYGSQDFERIRPIVNVDDALKKLIWVYENPDKVKQIEEQAYKWVQNYDWTIIAEQWNQLFRQVYKELENERKETKATVDPVKST